MIIINNLIFSKNYDDYSNYLNKLNKDFYFYYMKNWEKNKGSIYTIFL